MNIAFIKTSPKDMRNQTSINLGFEIIKRLCESNGHNVDVFEYYDTIPLQKYSYILFNVFYLTNQLNILPFLKKNKIPLLKKDRVNYPLLIGGGQGFINSELHSEVLDLIIKGEGENAISKILDGCELIPEDFTWWHKDTIDSYPVIQNGNVVIELTRGCKHRCNFCCYGWTSGKYREKDFAVVVAQIRDVIMKGYKNINFLSCNFGGYSKVVQLIEFCNNNKVRIANTDFRIDDYIRISKQSINMAQTRLGDIIVNPLEAFKTIKVGLESLNELTRYISNKIITDDQVNEFLDIAIKYASNIHLYLIYGLPEEDYSKWFEFIRNTKEKIAKVTTKKIRIEYSITNFEPIPGTPFEFRGQVDFTAKELFIREYVDTLIEAKILNPSPTWNYKTMLWRVGRSFESYYIYMWLLKADSNSLEVLDKLNLKGISRSMDKSIYTKLKLLVGE